MKPKVKINFVDFWSSNVKENELYLLLIKHFDLELTNDPDFVIYSCFWKEFLKYNCVRIFYIGENIRPNFNECDYSFSYDYPVDDKNYRLPLYRLYLNSFEKVKNRKAYTPMPFDKNRKFCNFVYSNLAAKDRIVFFNKLSHYKRVDSGVRSENNLGYFIDDKIKFLSEYKFSIAFENSLYPGYTTEKFFTH